MWGVDTSTKEGKLLVSALVILSTKVYPKLTNEEILTKLEKQSKPLKARKL